jgi:hypothetical protein
MTAPLMIPPALAKAAALAVLDQVPEPTAKSAAPAKRTRKPPAASPDPFPIIEPWPDPVSGADLLDDLVRLVVAYVVLPLYGPEVVALWLVHTYLLDATDYTPYLAITSPVRECGKSTLLDLLVHLAHRAQQTGGITAAALYRRIDRQRPAMLLDELDTRLRGDSGEFLRGVLNTGFHRSGRITVCSGDNHDDKDFSTFCAKVLAGIGRLWDTVTSRSIRLRLERASKAQLRTLRKIRGDRIAAECAPYRRKLRRFADDVLPAIIDADPEVPDALSARQADVWTPLFAIADVAGGHWPATARTAALALHGIAEEEGDHGLLALQDVRDLFTATDAPALASAFIVEKLNHMEERPWPEFSRGNPLTMSGLAKLLGRFDVKPRPHRIGDTTTRGYGRGELHPLFATYLRDVPAPAPAKLI